MRMMLSGFTGWMRMDGERSASVRATDTALTVVGTLMVAAAWAMLR